MDQMKITNEQESEHRIRYNKWLEFDTMAN